MLLRRSENATPRGGAASQEITLGMPSHSLHTRQNKLDRWHDAAPRQLPRVPISAYTTLVSKNQSLIPRNQRPFSRNRCHPSRSARSIPRNQEHPPRNSRSLPRNQRHPSRSARSTPRNRGHPYRTAPRARPIWTPPDLAVFDRILDTSATRECRNRTPRMLFERAAARE